MSGKAGAMPNHRNGLVGRSCRGLRTGHRHSGVSQEPERSRRLHSANVGGELPNPKTPGPRPASGLEGDTNTGARGGIAKRRTTKRGEKDGGKSEYFILLSNQGNRT